jgi:RNA polymerase sigma-70 factor (ECF subfamily)
LQDKNEHINRLLQRCKEEDQTAQFEIYKLYYKAMFNTALRIVKDSFEAEDVMQEAFLNAFTKLDSFIGDVPFGAWLKKIVVNKSLTQLKKNSRLEEVKLETVDYKLADGITEDSQENDATDYTNLKVKEILAKIKQLKDNYRIALTLSLIEGYDNEEIAEIMKITNENCRTTISRAKNKLRSLMNEQVQMQ